MPALAWVMLAVVGLPAALPDVKIPAIVYHDIVEHPGSDPHAITRAAFLEQMQYLRERGYTPVSLAQLEAVRQGRATLPPRPVLLTFDDGLKSYREIALPVLARYGYPSVLSVVTAWADGRHIPEAYRGRVLSWPELRAIARLPLVEVISHSDDLHHALPSNPQGNEAPAAVTRRYDPQTRRYETEDEFRQRVRADLERSHARLRAELGRDPIGIAWPYGEYDQGLVEEAARLGMVYSLTLDSEPTTLATLPRIARMPLERYRSLADFDDLLTFRAQRRLAWRFVRLDMDVFAGRSPAEQEWLLSRLLARLQLLQVNAVLIAPLSRDGARAYFANALLPVEADLLNRVLHQITVRNGIRYRYLEIPARSGPRWYELYTDLARLNRFNGIVLTGEVNETTLSPLRALFAHYQPRLRLGVTAPVTAATAAAADFVFIPLDAALKTGQLERQARQGLKDFRRPVFFLLRRPNDLPDDRLVRAMRALRAAGARHYGYDNDDFLHDVPALRRVVGELHAHVAGTED